MYSKQDHNDDGGETKILIVKIAVLFFKVKKNIKLHLTAII